MADPASEARLLYDIGEAVGHRVDRMVEGGLLSPAGSGKRAAQNTHSRHLPGLE